MGKLNNRTTWAVVGSLGVIGLGATAAAGIGPFAPSSQTQEHQWDGVQLRPSTPGTTVSPTTISAGSAVTTVSAQSSPSPVSPASPVSPPSPDTPPSPPTPASPDSPASPPSADSGD